MILIHFVKLKLSRWLLGRVEIPLMLLSSESSARLFVELAEVRKGLLVLS